jgi:hypothetical protein
MLSNKAEPDATAKPMMLSTVISVTQRPELTRWVLLGMSPNLFRLTQPVGPPRLVRAQPGRSGRQRQCSFWSNSAADLLRHFHLRTSQNVCLNFTGS